MLNDKRKACRELHLCVQRCFRTQRRCRGEAGRIEADGGAYTHPGGLGCFLGHLERRTRRQYDIQHVSGLVWRERGQRKRVRHDLWSTRLGASALHAPNTVQGALVDDEGGDDAPIAGRKSVHTSNKYTNLWK